jgi:hypothetical protein
MAPEANGTQVLLDPNYMQKMCCTPTKHKSATSLFLLSFYQSAQLMPQSHPNLILGPLP